MSSTQSGYHRRQRDNVERVWKMESDLVILADNLSADSLWLPSCKMDFAKLSAKK